MKDYAGLTIINVINFLKNSLIDEKYALAKGLLQAIDVRTKIISCLVILVSALLIKNASVLFLLYLLCLLLVCLSKIDLKFFLLRTLIFVPLFSLFIIIPSIFNQFSPGDAIFSFRIFSVPLSVTRQGFFSAAVFILRVVVSISIIAVLSITTHHRQLLKSLRFFGIPQIFILILNMTYRYIYLFLDIIYNSYLALKSRAGVALKFTAGQKVSILNIALLWQRSQKVSTDAYLAMLSRGFSGQVKTYDEFSFDSKDIVFITIISVFSIILIAVDKFYA